MPNVEQGQVPSELKPCKPHENNTTVSGWRCLWSISKTHQWNSSNWWQLLIKDI